MSLRQKFPSISHIPFSKSADSDDKTLRNMHIFENKEVVITEKMDGENTSLYSDYIHARSIDSRHHPSRDWIKAQHAAVKYMIPDGWQIVGENLYAQHSIPYYNLESYFYVFAIIENGYCLSWDDVKLTSSELGFPTAPVLWRGEFDEKVLHEIIRSLDTERQEGVVIRNTKNFKINEFDKNIAKWVRPNHVQTDKHWKDKTIVRNGLRK